MEAQEVEKQWSPQHLPVMLQPGPKGLSKPRTLSPVQLQAWASNACAWDLSMRANSLPVLPLEIPQHLTMNTFQQQIATGG